MNKRTSHRGSNIIVKLAPWVLLGLAVTSGIICVLALRVNNQHMVKLRNDVYQADQNGDDVTKSLQTLQAYVTTHMNTNLSAGNTAVYPPIQLKYSYDRQVKAADAAKSQDALYSQAQAYCEAQNSADFSGRNRVPCIEQYVQSHGGTAINTATVPDALYKFSFVSPRWSPDLAGWSMALALACAVLFVPALIIRIVLRDRQD